MTAFYVSPSGNDSGSGKLAAPNKGKTDGPFASVVRVRDAVRALKNEQGGLKQPVTVFLRGGTYYLTEPLVLGPEDSGTKEFPVVYTAYKGEKPVLSGGRQITGWKPVQVEGKKLWAAEVPEVKEGKWYFRQLFANGKRLARTRLPKDGFYKFAGLPDVTAQTPWNQGQTKAQFSDGDIRNWKNLNDVDVIALHFWVDSRMPITSVDEQAKTVNFGKKSIFRLTEGYDTKVSTRYFVENVFEALDTPGQWYLDRGKGVVYYLPRRGEDPNKMAFVAPRLEKLLMLSDTSYVSLRNIGFAHTEWSLPADSAGASQAAVIVPGAILLDKTHFCSVKGCNISQIGNYAIELGAGCEDNEIAGNVITDMGAGGIKVGHDSARTLVSDNHISDGGKMYHAAIGVWVGNSGYNKVVHNHIHDLYYTGISVGWSWGYGQTKTVDNEIAYNHIHHVGRGWLTDLGGIYTLGLSPGCVLHHNLIHDCYSATYGGWGIYLDEGTTNMLVRDNVVYNTRTGGFHQHYGKNNLIQNNVFAFAKEHQIQRTRPEEHTSFKFERNIVYFNEGILLGGNWQGDHYKMDYNLYYDASKRPMTFAGATLADWQKRGMDVHSIIADPLFVNPAKYDFTLQPTSPAFKLGFQPIDLSQVGPRVGK